MSKNKKWKAIVSWSGGKDCCFACYQALAEGVEIAGLLNCASEEYRRSSAHGVRIELVALQAGALGLPLYQNLVKQDDYEEKFKSALLKLKKQGVDSIVTGDIHLADSRDWMNKVCRETGVEPIMPLWGKDTKEIMSGFIAAGFEAYVVCGKGDLFGAEWMGRRVDRGFAAELEKVKSEVDLCGEKGEYHTFVVNGPLFKERVGLALGQKVFRNGYWFQDLTKKT